MRRSGGRTRFALRVLGVEAVLRLAGCGLAVAAGRARAALARRARPAALPAGRAGPSPDLREAEARRLARTLGLLKGPFAKAGQFASLRVDVLPEGVRAALAPLRDRVPPLPFPAIRAVLERELGGPLEARFAAFDPEPLGAASVAQVHRAALPDGTAVAVKVQYPWLAAALPRDLALLRALLRLAQRGRGRDARARRRALFEEFAAGLAEELDFVREADAGEAVAAALADDAGVVVPRVHRSHSTRRVLTTDYHAGVPVTDRAGLARLGVRPDAVLAILLRAYARQVFGRGLFHADPHPGNLLVLDEPGAAESPRLLFVDFGLSRRLEPALRRGMRRGLRALLQGDREAFVAAMERLGLIAPGARPEVARAVDAMLARLRAEDAAPLALGPERVLALKEEAKALLEETPGVQLPRDLLLYAKTLAYVVALGRELDPEADLMRHLAPPLLRFLAERDEEETA